MITMHQASIDAVCDVARHLRHYDRMEIAGVLGEDFDPAWLAHKSMEGAGDMCWTVHEDGVPIACWGVGGSVPRTVAHPWAWGTERFKRAVPMITRTQYFVRASLADAGIRRLEIRSHVSHDLSRRWLTGKDCGFHQESVLEGFGVDGSDYVLFVRHLTDADKRVPEHVLQRVFGQ